jgi:Tol biopolymer transport system component
VGAVTAAAVTIAFGRGGAANERPIVLASNDAPHFRTSELYVIGSAGGTARNLTRNRVEDVDPAWSPAGRVIAFARHVGRSFDLFTLTARGGRLRRLTWTRGNEREPAWSPDGKRLAFVAPGAERNEKGYRPRQVFVVNRDGSGRRQLTHDECGVVEPAWSPDGTSLAAASCGAVVRVSSSGAIHVLVSFDGDELAFDPAWSPDGRRIAYTRTRSDLNTRDLWVVNADGSGRRRLAKFAGAPVWSPHGTRIAFVNGPVWSCDRDGCYEDGLSAVATIAAAGGRKRFLTRPLERAGGSDLPEPERWGLGAGATFFGVSWSPDGRHIVFARRLEQRPPDIVRISPSGGASHALRTTSTVEVEPRVSPDGTLVAFEEHEQGHPLPSLELMRLDGRGVRVLAAAGRDPTWSRDSRRLAWVAQRLNGSSISSTVVVAEGDGRRARAIGSGTSPTWSPRGDQVAYARVARDGRGSRIEVARADGSDVRTALVVPRREVRDLAWSPQADVLVYSVGVSSRVVQALWTLDLRSGRARPLTDAHAYESGPVWSPDGSRLAFTRSTSDPSQLRSTVCVVSPGRRARCLGRSRWRSESPAWSPDGRRLAFTSTRDGDSEVYVAPARGGAWRQLTHNRADDAYPSW